MNPYQALIEAAEALLSKLEQIEPYVNDLSRSRMVRTGQQYDGPNYAQEKTTLLAAISSAKAAEEGVDDKRISFSLCQCGHDLRNHTRKGAHAINYCGMCKCMMFSVRKKEGLHGQ